MLLFATIFWGVSFPVMRSIAIVQKQMLPDPSSWFMTSATVFVRFGVSALLLALWSWRTLRQMNRLEIWQGAGLAFFGGPGILIQMDGLAHTDASTSAFLTQCYCVLIPIIVAVRERRWPSRLVVICTILVMAGVTVLSRFDWRMFSMGRGELETLIGSLLFTGQILWLERPIFAPNRVNHFSLVMFAGIALLALPVLAFSTNRPGDLLLACRSPVLLGLTAILVLACTMVSYMIMNHWQPRLPATDAGLIYAVEPVFASFFALFLPEWFGRLGGFHYINESLTRNLLIGGGLITVANVLIQSKPAGKPLAVA
ncbi:MAG TPA: DMT family transporter [Verrucomicrobiae bacterium]|jgi:drug/metabolite transporter (DMT)-like permease